MLTVAGLQSEQYDDLQSLMKSRNSKQRITEALNIGIPLARGFKVASKITDDAMRAGKNSYLKLQT